MREFRTYDIVLHIPTGKKCKVLCTVDNDKLQVRPEDHDQPDFIDQVENFKMITKVAVID
jgi:hypothetical protein